MIVLIARYSVRPGHVDEALEHLRLMAERVRADEPGCALYQVCQSLEQPNELLLYEQYRDEEAMRVHRQTPHFLELVEGKVAPLLDGRARELYDLVVA